ncbi:unnamed protein product [Rotaria sp. Silwood2]|nr:unnamed protein product [Rotaria sp. Silwood2]CAF4180295.1 unnamed protein product [Rotaria sp. Silwood2]
MATAVVMSECKRINLVPYNNKKAELIEYPKQHGDILAQHKLYGTDTTLSLVEKELNITVTNFENGSLDQDQQLGAKITKYELDVFIFFIDPLDSHPHTTDIQTFIRLVQAYGIISVIILATVYCIVNSNKMNENHVR